MCWNICNLLPYTLIPVIQLQACISHTQLYNNIWLQPHVIWLHEYNALKQTVGWLKITPQPLFLTGKSGQSTHHNGPQLSG